MNAQEQNFYTIAIDTEILNTRTALRDWQFEDDLEY